MSDPNCSHVFAGSATDVCCTKCDFALEIQDTHQVERRESREPARLHDRKVVLLISRREPIVETSEDDPTPIAQHQQCLMPHHNDCKPWHCSYLQDAIAYYLQRHADLVESRAW